MLSISCKKFDVAKLRKTFRPLVPGQADEVDNTSTVLKYGRCNFTVAVTRMRAQYNWLATDAITETFDRVNFFVKFKNGSDIENPADSEIRAVIRFLNARDVKPDDFFQISEAYGETL